MSNPARGYTWPPFERGNQAAVTHGVFAANRSEMVQAEVEAIAEQVADRFPWTSGYEDERRAYARALCDEQTVRDYLDQVGPLDQHQHERPAVRTLERFSARAARCRAALGLSPMAHARLLALVAEVVRLHPDRSGPLDGSLDGLLAEGRAALMRGSGTDAPETTQMPGGEAAGSRESKPREDQDA